MHWNGTAWSVSTSFVSALGGQLGIGVADISPTDAYAVGGGLGSAHTGLVAQWNGTTWTRVDVPLPKNNNMLSDLDAISADSASDVWIVGTYLFEVNPSDYAEEDLLAALERQRLEHRADAAQSRDEPQHRVRARRDQGE